MPGSPVTVTVRVGSDKIVELNPSQKSVPSELGSGAGAACAGGARRARPAMVAAARAALMALFPGRERCFMILQ
ncbi:3-oxoacyl-ACP synthase [Leifsonia xyli subsp. cynodontis DSM 46306]|uniref:Uncharacterized protein n=1 Tax=Leifsonia xyli subsp. cynodontis DSM 46306 TaxID=1389489 RepID=U3P7H0_LEIXC|nr:3-oxoacyl-ACP synthase [Leifsonia xyli subsp. cynodontis DSM 46306]